jgi:hypothetical protein
MVDSAQNTSNATLEVPDDKRNEEAIFVRMLSEFNNGISEISNAHNKLTLQLQGMDDINIENLTTGERVAAKLVEELDKCEELMSFLSDRLQTYDDVLNVSLLEMLTFINYLLFRRSKKAWKTSWIRHQLKPPVKKMQANCSRSLKITLVP